MTLGLAPFLARPSQLFLAGRPGALAGGFCLPLHLQPDDRLLVLRPARRAA